MPPSRGPILLLRSTRFITIAKSSSYNIKSFISSPGNARLLRTMASEPNYDSWTKASLIKKVKALEYELSTRPVPPQTPAPDSQLPSDNGAQDADSTPPQQPAKKPKAKRKIDPSKYSTRYIALKLAYLGKRYGGFEFQPTASQSSIEEELWKALTKACLVFPEDPNAVDFECCEYSKCGRTDRGVSAFGQVIGLRVRSNRPLPKKRVKLENQEAASEAAKDTRQDGEEQVYEEEDTKAFDPIRDELQYPRLLNRILPPDIRILAWCPSPPPDFSARFSCRERQYRYFFTQPAFTPSPPPSEPIPGSAGGAGVGWLDIAAMRDAAKRFEGEHDFRNVCKIDAAKQIVNFSRVIFEADIVEVSGSSSSLPYLANSGKLPADVMNNTNELPKVYSFNVRGSAFLWHQIRHMVAILFAVGQGLEQPSVVTELLDVQRNPSKPKYAMADEVPLVLWDCIFPQPGDSARKDALEWVYTGAESPGSRAVPFGLLDSVWSTWRERKMDELLANQLLRQISQASGAERIEAPVPGKVSESAVVYEGGNSGRSGGKYVPIMARPRMESPEEQNEKYAKRKGYASAEDMRVQKGFRTGVEKESEADE